MPKVSNEATAVSDVNNPHQEKHGVSKKPRKARLRKSNFHIIINTNVRYNAGSQELENTVSRLRVLTDEFVKEGSIQNFMKFLDGGNWEQVESVKTKQTVERGPAYDQPHVHIMIMVDHRTKIHMDAERISQHFTRGLGLYNNTNSKVYVRVVAHRVQDSFEEVVSNYIKKNLKPADSINSGSAK